MFPIPRTIALFAAVIGAAHAGPVDAEALAANCTAGDGVACLTLARARTGAGLPVDLVSAREAYDRACAQGLAEGCAGVRGIARLLGRHVDLHLLRSVPRVWVLAGPSRVLGPGELAAAGPAVRQAVEDRLAFAEACYAAAVEEDRALGGMLDLSLVIAGGRVDELVLHQASLSDEGVARCIVEELGRTRLPPGEPDGELFVRLRAEPAPARDRNPPVIQDHLADGAQATIGDPQLGLPADSPDRRRLEIAVTAAARKALAGAPCVVDDVETGHWDPVVGRIDLVIEPEGRASSVMVTTEGEGREELARCFQSHLDGLPVGQTGLPDRLAARLQVRVAPIWTDTWVP